MKSTSDMQLPIASPGPRPTAREIYDAFDADDRRIGSVLRTSPATDDVMGYQGPTDGLIGLDMEDRVVGVSIHASYDNEPYVG